MYMSRYVEGKHVVICMTSGVVGWWVVGDGGGLVMGFTAFSTAFFSFLFMYEVHRYREGLSV